jgi:hypothetical protein
MKRETRSNRSGPDGSAQGRPFLSVNFACCSVYQRIYRNVEGTAYVGHCPKCGKSVRFPVGPGGTEARQFIVY